MRIDVSECAERVAGASFGVLGTVDADYGVHLVPVVYVVDGERLAVPVDTVKSKTSPKLRRIDNLERDPRATLLVDHRDRDWNQLWWVRTALRFAGTADADPWRDPFADKYPQYRDTGSIAGVLEFTITGYRGWRA